MEEGETCVCHVNSSNLGPLIYGVVEQFSSGECAHIPRKVSFGY